MKNKLAIAALKRGLAAGLAVVLTAAAFPEAVPGALKGTAEAAEVTLKNPRIVSDGGMKAGQKVTWDCVWFGSYPQAEVIPSGVKYTALDSSLRYDGDVIVSDSVYKALQGASGWNSNNDITLNGAKYRRMKAEDALIATSDNSARYQWSNETDYHYFKYEPIKWRVLHTDGNQALLLSDVALDDQNYHTADESVTWETSTVRSWLNGYGAGSNKQSADYTQKNFIGSAFTASEQAAIMNSSLENADNIDEGTAGGNDTTDKIFLLSESDVWNTDKAKSYGFVENKRTSDEARLRKSSTWAYAMGTCANNGYTAWWLRSPGRLGAQEFTGVEDTGEVYTYGYGVGCCFLGVCPALNLNLPSTNLCTYAGTVCSDGTTTEVDAGTVTLGGKKPGQMNPPTGQKDDSGKAVYKVIGRLKYKVSKVHANGAGEVTLIGIADKKDAEKLTTLKTGNTVKINKKNFKVTAIAKNAFKNCKKLKSVVIGKYVTSIGAKAFNGCKSLKKLTIKSAKLKKVGKNAFKGIHAKAVIKVPKAKLKAYKKLLRKKGQGKKVRIVK